MCEDSHMHVGIFVYSYLFMHFSCLHKLEYLLDIHIDICTNLLCKYIQLCLTVTNKYETLIQMFMNASVISDENYTSIN